MCSLRGSLLARACLTQRLLTAPPYPADFDCPPLFLSPLSAGSMFASASQDGSVAVWDHRSSALVAHFLTPLVSGAASLLLARPLLVTIVL